MAEQDLTLVGLTEDKSTLILVSHSGAEFTLAADDKIFAEFYERSGSPTKKGRPTAEGDAKPPRRRTLAPKPEPGSP